MSTEREPHALIRDEILGLLDYASELTNSTSEDVGKAADALLEGISGAWAMLVASTDCTEGDIRHDAERLAAVAIKVQRHRKGREAA